MEAGLGSFCFRGTVLCIFSARVGQRQYRAWKGNCTYDVVLPCTSAIILDGPVDADDKVETLQRCGPAMRIFACLHIATYASYSLFCIVLRNQYNCLVGRGVASFNFFWRGKIVEEESEPSDRGFFAKGSLIYEWFVRNWARNLLYRFSVMTVCRKSAAV